MRWRFQIASDASSIDPDLLGDPAEDHLIIDELTGPLGITYLNDIAAWFSDNNIREGYQVQCAGSCFKGPYGIQWKRIEITFDNARMPTGLSQHLQAIWGDENTSLAEGHSTCLSHIA